MVIFCLTVIVSLTFTNRLQLHLTGLSLFLIVFHISRKFISNSLFSVFPFEKFIFTPEQHHQQTNTLTRLEQSTFRDEGHANYKKYLRANKKRMQLSESYLQFETCYVIMIT